MSVHIRKLLIHGNLVKLAALKESLLNLFATI